MMGPARVGAYCVCARALRLYNYGSGSEFRDGWMISRDASGRRARREFSNVPGGGEARIFQRSLYAWICVPEIAISGARSCGWSAGGVRASLPSFWSWRALVTRWALLSGLVRRVVRQSLGLLSRVRARTWYSRLESGRGFVLLFGIFRLMPDLGVFVMALRRPPVDVWPGEVPRWSVWCSGVW